MIEFIREPICSLYDGKDLAEQMSTLKRRFLLYILHDCNACRSVFGDVIKNALVIKVALFLRRDFRTASREKQCRGKGDNREARLLHSQRLKPRAQSVPNQTAISG